MFQSYTRLVEYNMLPVDAPENKRVVQDLLAAIAVSGTEGLGYMAFEIGDGNFLHIAFVDTQLAKDTLHGLSAFQAWARNLTQDLGISPKFTDVDVIGTAGVNPLAETQISAQKPSKPK